MCVNMHGKVRGHPRVIFQPRHSLLLLFFKAVSLFSVRCCPPPPTEVSPLCLACFVFICESEPLIYLGSRILLTTSSGVRGTHHHPGFSPKSSVEQTPFFVLAREAHYQLSHLSVRPSFFLLSLFRRQTSYLSGS